MKKSVALLLLMAMFVYCGCAKDPVKEDFLKYINDDEKLSSLQTECETLYGSEAGTNFKNYESTLRILELVIPKYQDYLDQLKKMKYTTPEVLNLQNIQIQCVQARYNFLHNLQYSLIDPSNQMAVIKAEEEQQKVDTCYRDWKAKVIQVANDHKVKR